jgi:hypothetical protein
MSMPLHRIAIREVSMSIRHAAAGAIVAMTLVLGGASALPTQGAQGPAAWLGQRACAAALGTGLAECRAAVVGAVLDLAGEISARLQQF